MVIKFLSKELVFVADQRFLLLRNIGIGHLLVTCRSNDVRSLEVMLLVVTSLTNDVGHLPVTSSCVTYYYYNYFLK